MARRKEHKLPRAEPVKDVAESFGTSVDTLYRAFHAKPSKLRLLRFGSRLMVPAQEILRLSRSGLGPVTGKAANKPTPALKVKAT